jgi:large conductance mechanosensitive channel
MNTLKEFRTFLMRGNIVDLAVAVVIGAAFGALVTALVEDLITPVVAAIFGKPDFSDLTFTINDSVFKYGSFLNALIAFLSIATAIFFFVVKPMNALKDRMGKPEEKKKADDLVVLEEIRDLLAAQQGGGGGATVATAPPPAG